jgi:hypothetical protein
VFEHKEQERGVATHVVELWWWGLSVMSIHGNWGGTDGGQRWARWHLNCVRGHRRQLGRSPQDRAQILGCSMTWVADNRVHAGK